MKLAKFAFVCAAAAALTAVADDYTSSELAILPVANTVTNMPLAVCFTDANGGALTASNIVKTAGLPADAALYVYNATDKTYTKYTISGNEWGLANGGTTYVVDDNGQLTSGSATAAENLTVPRGAAVFLTTAKPNTTIYMPGKPASGTITTTLYPGANLIGAPTGTEVDLNELKYSNISNSTIKAVGTSTDDFRLIATGDVIEYASGNGGLRTRYYYNGSKWGEFVEIESSSGSGFDAKSNFVTTGITIPAGRGFWYIRAGNVEATITW